MDKQNLIEIEDYVQANIEKFHDILKGTQYQNIEKFKFLPGHRNLILSLHKHLNKKAKKSKTSDQKQRLSVHELKEALIAKFKNYAQKNLTFEYDISDDFNIEFDPDKNQYKCQYKCPFCIKKLSCMYTSYWNISNLTRHIKSNHTILEEIEFIADEEETGNSSLPNRIVRLEAQQHQHLMEYLNMSEEEQ